MNDELREVVKLWLEKAQNDWSTVRILMDREAYLNDIVCFHCQQYVEKLLKGFLTACEIEFPKTHDLRRLIQLSPKMPQLSVLYEKADELTLYGVQSRYPDPFSSISKEQVEEAAAAARAFADILEPALLGALNDED
jgi:HEPN domain-containing protein